MENLDIIEYAFKEEYLYYLNQRLQMVFEDCCVLEVMYDNDDTVYAKLGDRLYLFQNYDISLNTLIKQLLEHMRIDSDFSVEFDDDNSNDMYKLNKAVIKYNLSKGLIRLI